MDCFTNSDIIFHIASRSGRIANIFEVPFAELDIYFTLWSRVLVLYAQQLESFGSVSFFDFKRKLSPLPNPSSLPLSI